MTEDTREETLNAKAAAIGLLVAQEARDAALTVSEPLDNGRTYRLTRAEFPEGALRVRLEPERSGSGWQTRYLTGKIMVRVFTNDANQRLRSWRVPDKGLNVRALVERAKGMIEVAHIANAQKTDLRDRRKALNELVSRVFSEEGVAPSHCLFVRHDGAIRAEIVLWDDDRCEGRLRVLVRCMRDVGLLTARTDQGS